MNRQDDEPQMEYVAMEIRVRGRVQGVGFRPTVWRFARDLELCGEVLNDAHGVLVRVGGCLSAVDDLLGRIRSEPPPLATTVGGVLCALPELREMLAPWRWVTVAATGLSRNSGGSATVKLCCMRGSPS